MGCTKDTPKDNGCLQIISSSCVSWQGDQNTELDVSLGDTLSSVINSIFTNLTTITDGTSITVSLTNVCDVVNGELAGKTLTVQNVLQAITTVLCSVIDDVTQLQSNATLPATFSVVCLTDGGGTSVAQPINQTVQIIIDEVCYLKTAIADLTTELNNNSLTTTINNTVGNFLLDAITSCGNNGIIKNGSGESATIQFTGMVPYYCPIPFVGPSNWFDGTGRGLEQYGMCGWYVMNGMNGTPNWQGYTFAGATVLPFTSAPLDAAVAGVNDGANIGDKRGEVKHTLTIAELASHTHVVTDPGHGHSLSADVVSTGTTGATTAVVDKYTLPSSTSLTLADKVKTNTTGITIASTGGGESHENRQPTVYGIWIMRKPYQPQP